MDNFSIYSDFCDDTSKEITKRYSTSFYKSIQFFSPKIKHEIYNVYAFVRLADEIVDTFHSYDQEKILNQFETSYKNALEDGISIHPIIHNFCLTQKENGIEQNLVDSFLHSMRMDLGEVKDLNEEQYNEYIYGSAEVVGLMCLKIFVKGNEEHYNLLKPYAQKFGAALQKINFLRDVSDDFHQLNRVYFPNVNFDEFTQHDKKEIENDIENDFKYAIIGIRKLPKSSRLAVYLAYCYYYRLFNQIKRTNHHALFTTRVSVPNYVKSYLFAKVMIKKKFTNSL